MDFNNRNVVLTGGSNGIGFALSTALVAKGARVTNLDREKPINDIDGMTWLRCDIARADDVEQALNATTGTIDLLISNAGVIRRGPVLSNAEEEFDLLFNVNTKGPWLLLKQAIPLLSKNAIVLHVSSYRAAQSPSDPGLYASSKGAGEHIVRCTAEGAAFTVKIARLGPFATGMARQQSPVRPPAEAAELLLQLIDSDHSMLMYDPRTDAYTFER